MRKHRLRHPGILFLLLIAGLAAPGLAHAFGFDDVAAKAKALAVKAYAPPKQAPDFLTGLDYDQYQKIRFLPERSLWRASGSNFQVMFVAPGEYFRHVVRIHMVDAVGVHEVPFRKGDFSWPSEALEKKVPDDLGYAGFKLAYPINRPGVEDQFLAFAGVSYFRGVGRGDNFGLSARGIAIDTGLPGGEEFPDFTDFWLVRPRPDAHALRFFALLDGPSLTGAYRFVVYPGAPTRIEIKVALFLRKDVKLLGMAPLTSMFYYGHNTPRPSGEWRGAVHDSDGLLIHANTGEWLWRPLINPMQLQMDYFEADSAQGFGLLQRDRHFRDYQDAQARYDRRPSAWVTPHQDWGKGHVVLVEIPTDSETNDNIVAFWSPQKEALAGDRYDLDYTLYFGALDIADEPLATARNTFVGRGNASKASNLYRIVVDFAGGPLDRIASRVPVQAIVTGLDGSKIIQQNVEWVQALNEWRLSFLAQPAADTTLNLRAFLKSGQETLSETWSYALPAVNRINANGG
ncbi:MAG: glucan biosynthesis protein G [Gammaproteobacteria bacterium]